MGEGEEGEYGQNPLKACGNSQRIDVNINTYCLLASDKSLSYAASTLTMELSPQPKLLLFLARLTLLDLLCS